VTTSELYIALGDSTGVGLGAREGGYAQRLLARLRALRPHVRLLNLCQSGARSLDVLQDQVPDAAKLRPEVITLVVGINDVTHSEPEEAFTHNMEEIARRIKGLGARVVVANVPDIALAPSVRQLVPPEFFERRIEIFNRHIEATAARHGFDYVDFYGMSRKQLAEHPEYFSADGFHPSDAGYEAWTDILWPTVREAFERRQGKAALS
jgi:lysophospholipase L1-like esterase